MSEVTIVPGDDGPYHVTGDFVLIDGQGKQLTLTDSETWLCRCGHSTDKPFCTGSHHECGFKNKVRG
jgi:CDGSH-type Zn-finger protein